MCTHSRTHTLNWASGGPVIITILTLASGASAGAICKTHQGGMTRSGATDRNVTHTSLTFVHNLLKCKMKAFWKKATEQQWLTWVHYFWLLPWTEHLHSARPWCKCPHAISANPHWVLMRWYLYFTEGKQGWRSWVTWPIHDHIANPAGGRTGSVSTAHVPHHYTNGAQSVIFGPYASAPPGLYVQETAMFTNLRLLVNSPEVRLLE